MFLQKGIPNLRNLAQQADSGAGVLAAFGVVGAACQHGVRPFFTAFTGRRMKSPYWGAKVCRVTADFVQRKQAGIAVKRSVLGSLGSDWPGQLLELQCKISVSGVGYFCLLYTSRCV